MTTAKCKTEFNDGWQGWISMNQVADTDTFGVADCVWFYLMSAQVCRIQTSSHVQLSNTQKRNPDPCHQKSQARTEIPCCSLQMYMALMLQQMPRFPFFTFTKKIISFSPSWSRASWIGAIITVYENQSNIVGHVELQCFFKPRCADQILELQTKTYAQSWCERPTAPKTPSNPSPSSRARIWPVFCPNINKHNLHSIGLVNHNREPQRRVP